MPCLAVGKEKKGHEAFRESLRFVWQMRGKIEAAKYNYSLRKSLVTLFSALVFSGHWFVLFSALVFSGHHPSPATNPQVTPLGHWFVLFSALVFSSFDCFAFHPCA
ncbi:hypothetical protein DM860_011224 [Cuscuta australis]|uniref:Uncharacterized protein n=1 Tax=Cuscuta australis TaxID=267555 RepID=A0A328DPW5_9ASTE|nr:hypothetical protein DM860_011224 [Cuscuta australis]